MNGLGLSLLSLSGESGWCGRSHTRVQAKLGAVDPEDHIRRLFKAFDVRCECSIPNNNPEPRRTSYSPVGLCRLKRLPRGDCTGQGFITRRDLHQVFKECLSRIPTDVVDEVRASCVAARHTSISQASRRVLMEAKPWWLNGCTTLEVGSVTTYTHSTRLLREALGSAGAQAPCWECRAQPGASPAVAPAAAPLTMYTTPPRWSSGGSVKDSRAFSSTVE